MKKFNKNSIVTILSVAFALGITLPTAAFASTAPALGTASTFGIVSSTFTNSNTAPQTIITGDLCYGTGPATTPLTITGATVTPCASGTGTAQSSALADLNGQACTSLGTNVVLAGTYTPGCYSASGSMDIVANTTVTLNGPGVYIFKSVGAVTTGANSAVALAGGASASDVFWAPVAATTLGASTAFVGTILDAAGITMGHFATLLGRALAFGGTVTTDANTITVPSSSVLATLHVIKLVVNGNGGTATPSNFTMHVKDSVGAEAGGGPFSGAGGLGTAYSLSAGTYTITENSSPSYLQSFGADCVGGTVILSAGQDKICTVINTDIPAPRLQPANGNGSGYFAPVIVPLIGIRKVPTPLALPGGSGSVVYNYTVWNVGGQQALTEVTVTDDKCNPLLLLSGDSNSNAKLDPSENWKYSCTATLATTTTNTAIATGYSDDTYHVAAIASAVATVAVGVSVPPPLISIVKVPSRLTPFPFGGGPVIYSYTVTNPGVTPLHDVIVTDDKCAPVSRPFGDANGNNLLDPGEAWAYACVTNITVSTRNIATAQGKGNGLTALGYAFATVLVSPIVPALPNTGLPPGEKSALVDMALLSGILLSVSFLFVALRPHRGFGTGR